MESIEILEQSVKSLFLKMKVNDSVLSTGTGFLVQTKNGYALITNRHNVTGKDNNTGEILSPTGGIPKEIVISHNKQNALGNG